MKNERKECEKIWSENKYFVLSKSQNIYREIREYLKRDEPKKEVLLDFIKKAERLSESRGQAINAFQHIWGYFKEIEDEKKKEEFFALLYDYKNERVEQERVIQFLKELLKSYPNQYLQNSNIFTKGNKNERWEDKMNFRFAERKDVGLILQFIKELAVYDKLIDEVVTEEATLEEWIFNKKTAEVIFVMEEETEVGFALFFQNFSTFLGRAGLYLEDLYVKPEYRKKGYGKGLILKLAEIARERGLGRMEWMCLDWNRPSIDFYLSLGAKPMLGWKVYRVAGKELENLKEESLKLN